MSYNSKSGRGYGGIRHARNVQARRSAHAKAIDSQLKAPKAKNVDQWLSAPNRFDLPTVDTNKPKKRIKSCRVSDEEYFRNPRDFDRLVNKDDVSDDLKNKEAYAEILKTLENAKIPYSIGGEKGIYVLIDDMNRADKIIEKYYAILKRTS